MHGFSNAGYFLTLGFLSLIGSMAFWFRDVISEGRAKSFSFKVVLCNYILNIAKAIPKEEIKQILDNYSKDISNLRVKRLSNDEFGYYIAGLLEGHISLPALGNTKLSRVLNPRIVFTSLVAYILFMFLYNSCLEELTNLCLSALAITPQAKKKFFNS
jgi:hypothetical protein